MEAQTNHTPLLQVIGASKAFPGVQALDKVDFEADRGEVVALVGENGAGKSTLMKILSGVYAPDEGQILMDGTTVIPQNPHHAQELGISIIYQEFNLTPNQTVWSNVFLGREVRQKGLLGSLNLADRKTMRSEAAQLLKRLKARFSPDELVRNLSVAEMQMVEIAKALAVEAKVIIMDEPTSALGTEEVEILFDIVHNLKAQGLAMIFITHRLEEVFRIADRTIIFRDGRRVGSLSIQEATIEKIISLMVGRELDRSAYHQIKTKDAQGPPVLEVRGLNRKGVLENISFDVQRGEIFGIAGLIGAGRTELVRAIFGADPIDSGEIRINGTPTAINSPNAAVKAGIALVPENRQRQGLVLIQTVRNNIALPNLSALSKYKFVSQRLMDQVSDDFVKKLNIRTPSLFQRVLNLSGGNQQKVVLAKWLASNPKILILDEPTRGIDVGAKAEIYSIMHDLAEQGVSIIMISSEMPEILAMSDRILVMYEGRMTGILDRAEATQELIMTYASGHVLEKSN